MRALALLVAVFALAACGDDCPSSASGGQSCSSMGASCVVGDETCVCLGGLWECGFPDDGHYPPVHDLAVPDLSVRDLSPASD